MNYEKSCGAVNFKQNNDEIEYLLIFNKKGNAKGHWGFAKGHTEDGETEEQTAIREIKEETGLDVILDTRFREVLSYIPKKDVIKDAVYFVAECKNFEVVLQESEVADFKWCTFSDAIKTLSFGQDILKKANEYIKTRK